MQRQKKEQRFRAFIWPFACPWDDLELLQLGALMGRSRLQIRSALQAQIARAFHSPLEDSTG